LSDWILKACTGVFLIERPEMVESSKEWA
jgi:hypothetical protein